MSHAVLNNTRNVKKGIYIHAIPYLDEKKFKEIMGRICLWNARELETYGPVTPVSFYDLKRLKASSHVPEEHCDPKAPSHANRQGMRQARDHHVITTSPST